MNENEINKEILFLKNITHIYNQDHQKIIINDTFGPLKFDNKDKLVFHLMIYDVSSHYKLLMIQ